MSPPAFISKIFSHGNDISKEAALAICYDHLGGDWDGLDVEDFDLRVVQ